LANFPEATFILRAKSIPDSRVHTFELGFFPWAKMFFFNLLRPYYMNVEEMKKNNWEVFGAK
jgi:hypothetical protein